MLAVICCMILLGLSFAAAVSSIEKEGRRGKIADEQKIEKGQF